MQPTSTHNTPTVGERTYSLTEAAHIICGDATESSQLWLVRRLRGHGTPTITGYKVSRRWRMTETDVANAINALRPGIRPPAYTTMTARSRRRMTAS